MYYSDFAVEISNIYGDILHKIPFVQHLDQDDSGQMFWETYYIPNTIFRLFLHGDIDSTMDIATVTLSVEIDPDYDDHSDFSNNNHDIFKFEIDLEKLADNKYTDKERDKVYEKLNKGVDMQLDALREEAQFCLKNIEKDLENVENINKMRKIINFEHDWVIQDWVSVQEVIELSGFGILEIPNTLKAFGLENNNKFITQEMKDMFIF